MSRIILTTINARYVHAALGLRYLAANLGELQRDARIVELARLHEKLFVHLEVIHLHA